MTMRTKAVGILAAGACLALLAGGARAQTGDHLKCYKMKDPAVHTLYTANLTGLGPDWLSLRARARGRVVVHVRFSPYWKLEVDVDALTRMSLQVSEKRGLPPTDMNRSLDLSFLTRALGAQ